MQFLNLVPSNICNIKCFKFKRLMNSAENAYKNISIFSLFFLLFLKLDAQHVSGFIENKGQFYDQMGKDVSTVKYLHRGKTGLSTQFQSDGFSYELQSRKNESKKNPLAKDLLLVHRVDIKFKNQSPNCEIQKIGETESQLNYYLRGKHIEGVSAYSQLLYKNVWNNIDLIFKESRGQIKYEFVLRPGAKVSDIQFEILGSNGIEFSKKQKDQFTIKTSLGKITDKIPFTFETTEKENIRRKAQWLKLGENLIGVSIDQWNEKNLLTIDPVPILIWGTYYGGANKDEGKSTDVDSNGNPIFLGVTSSTGLTTTGAHQTVLRANDDIYLLKKNKAGGTGSKIWCTYFGSDSVEIAGSVSIDKQQNIYI